MRRTYPGFKRWMLGNCCAAVGMAGVAARGIVPDWVSVVVTNAATFAGVVFLLEGSREFLHLRPVHLPARVLAGLCLAAELYFLAVVNNIGIRILVASLCLGLLTAATGATLLQGARKSRKLSFLFAGTFFLLNSIFNFARGISTLQAWPSQDLFAPTLVNQLYFGGMTITVIGWAIGFILLTNDRLVEELTAAERRTARLNQDLQFATEQATAAARQAAESDQAKSDFLAYIGHEIRNPLGGVLFLCELILDGPLNDEKREDMETLRASANSVLSILNDLLDLSKVEAGRMPIVEVPFDLEAELTQVADVFSPQARAKATNLFVSYPHDLPRRFAGDGPRIRQIVSNFVSNAVKFTEQGEIHIGVEARGGAMRISVRDTGVGIASETLPRLFNKFAQAGPSAYYRGTGLGLAISKQLAELMDGSVGVESREGQGSTFWVELPLESAAPEVPEVPAHAPPAASGEPVLAGSRVLLAEDNVFSQKVLSKLLTSYGMLVDVAGNGKDAVTKFAQADYAVILMDCQMPEMDGYEATRRIRALEDGRGMRTPVIAITALAVASEQSRCREAGMDDFLVKPFAPEQLLECIAGHVSRKPKAAE
jgi:signal transduction histidine kinase/CheY-like chemotaxis protein